MSDGPILRLSDGRALAYREVGDSGGQPVFFFHGGFGSRLEQHPDSSIAERAGVRLLSVDRPGHGRSTFVKHSSLLGFAADLGELADSLGLSEFGVAAWSGGTPFALACAAAYPSRVRSVLLCGSFAPPEAGGFAASAAASLARLARPLIHATSVRSIRKITADLPSFLDTSMSRLCEADQEISARPEIREMFLSSYAEALSGGAEGASWGLALGFAAWRLPLEAISAPVHLWVGENDTVTPPAFSGRLAKLLPSAQLRVFPDEGHLQLLDHWEEGVRLAAGCGR